MQTQKALKTGFIHKNFKSGKGQAENNQWEAGVDIQGGSQRGRRYRQGLGKKQGLGDKAEISTRQNLIRN